MKIACISLGCPKNQVDLDVMVHILLSAGHETVADLGEADVILVNTCGFIESAKTEAIENILEACAYKQQNPELKVIVTGCLAERYRSQIEEEIPEVDAVVGCASNKAIDTIVARLFHGENHLESYGAKKDFPLGGKRVIGTPAHYAYLKIAEGCNNCCTYCAIPMIRGGFRSVPMEDVLEEAKWLAEHGVTELTVIAQDTTRYGEDLYGESRLPELLEQLCRIESIRWIRVLYCYPERITDKLLEVMAREEKLVKYLDIPIQHCNGDILRRMNRQGDAGTLATLLNKIRQMIPDITLRTTLITGFPGETEEEHRATMAFVEKCAFARIHVFPYSRRSGTVADKMENQVPEEIKHRRTRELIELGNRLEEKFVKSIEGTVQTVLFERSDGNCAEGYTQHYVRVCAPAAAGSLVQVRISRTDGCVALGEPYHPDGR